MPSRNGHPGPRTNPPYPPDVLAIGGTAIDLAATNTSIDHLVAFARGAAPQLSFSRLVGTPGALPDPWNLKSCTLTMQSTVVFRGTVQGYTDHYDTAVGWLREYRAFGLYYSGNYVPVTDGLTLTDTSIWNQPGDDVTQIPSRAGKTVGEVVAAILTMAENAVPLDALGLGAYTSLSPPTLPSATTGDLAALAVIPQWAVRISGERILPALEAFVQQFHPNHYLYVSPNGTIRFLDPRASTNIDITLNDPADHRWEMPTLTRDATDNYSRVHVRGTTLARAVNLQDVPWPGSTAADGGLAEDFAHDGLSNAAAKAAWHPTDWSQPSDHGAPMEAGACTCPDSLHVTITTTRTFAADELAQGAGDLLGWVNLSADSLGGLVTQYWLARVVANTATSGGTCTLTLDAPLPSLAFNSYQLFGLAAGANVVGRRYKVTNPAIAHKLLLSFPWPVPYRFANGTGAEMVSTPVGTVGYNATGSGPPYTSSTVNLTVDPEGGRIYFNKPVQVVAGGLQDPPRWPAFVQALLAVAVGTLDAYAPHAPGDPTTPAGYAGTLFTVEGVQRTKVITVMDWRDYGNNAAMATYAAEVLDALKDVVVEGSLPYAGLVDLAWLTPGRSVSIHGGAGLCGFTTGWESLALPVVSVEVAFQYGASGTSYATTLQLSNRRTPYDASNFLRPALTGMAIGGSLSEPFGAGLASSQAESQRYADASELQRRQVQAVSDYRGMGALPRDFRSLGFTEEDIARPGFTPRGALGALEGRLTGGAGTAGFTGGAVGPTTGLGGIAGAAGDLSAGLSGAAGAASAGPTGAAGDLAAMFGASAAMAGGGMGVGTRVYRPEELRQQQEERARREEDERAEAKERDRRRREREDEIRRDAARPEFIPRRD